MPVRNERSIFLDALDCVDLHARESFLREACADDKTLRASVDALLAAHEVNDNPLDVPLVAGSTRSASAVELASENKPGELLAGYRILSTIGEGGFGFVYSAEQTEPIRRVVALKVLKFGLDSKEIVARFQAERQAIAMMEHEYIAKIFDAGLTENGQSYFAMELVDGLPITEFCWLHSLSLEDRLQLFVDVCTAIQHAHQKGIIHRDLKPSNILVTISQ